LFSDNRPGEYTYEENSLGKTAYGQLTLAENVSRDNSAQREAGGDARRGAGSEYGIDDGGHIIGARFNGSPTKENLAAQDRNLNRSDYSRMENHWADLLKNGDRVFVNMDAYDKHNSGRPFNYQGYAIIEHTDEKGNVSRNIEYYSFNNESRAEHERWEEDLHNYEVEHPEFNKDDISKNNVMPFIWDNEKQEIVENPTYTIQESLPAQNPEELETNNYGFEDLPDKGTLENLEQNNEFGITQDAEMLSEYSEEDDYGLSDSQDHSESSEVTSEADISSEADAGNAGEDMGGDMDASE
jgi:hypothetical protein